ncbi:MAG: tetratricopeptide repeat protein [Planctomycetes bacterium]|nr:tetratricopeptide repeat protein [Planctomycetota bacterium]
MKLLTVSLTLAAMLGVDAAATAQSEISDTVMTTTGRRFRGIEIVGLTDSKLTYKSGSEEKDIRASQVAEITWSEPPQAFALGRAAAAKGDFATAANQYEEAARASSRPVFQTECRYLAAQSLARGGRTDPGRAKKAAEELAAWLDQNADGFRRPDALLWRGRALVAAGMFAEAQTTFEQLADDSLSRGWLPVWNARAKLELAAALQAAGNFAGARSAYRAAVTAVRGAAGDDPDAEFVQLEAQANVGVGESMVQEGNFEDALKYFRDLGSRGAAPALRAAARAGEGEALFLQSQKSGDGSALRAAQVALAEASVLDTTNGDTTAKALYYSGRVLLALGPDRESQTYKQRAASYFDTVVRSYGTSVWASRAAEELRR